MRIYHMKKTKQKNVGEDAAKKEFLSRIGGNVGWYNPWGKLEISQKEKKKENSVWPSSTSTRYLSK